MVTLIFTAVGLAIVVGVIWGTIALIKQCTVNNNVYNNQAHAVICPSCGRVVKLGSQFCVSCGASLENTQTNHKL